MIAKFLVFNLTRVPKEDIFKKLVTRSGLDVRMFKFSNRILEKWNSVSDNYVNCTMLNWCLIEVELKDKLNMS